MLIELKGNDTYNSEFFGGVSPYWIQTPSGEVFISDTFDEIISLLPKEDRYIDPAGVASLLQFNYIHGDRTLVKKISKIPWRATLNAHGKIVRKRAIKHGTRIIDPKKIAHTLKDLLLKELSCYISNYSNVYILLSGGLDSRVTAGLLKKLQQEYFFKVTAVTWGADSSRDVTYAKRIANLYNWKFIHFPLNSEILKKNIFESVRYCGGEIAGIHLHGMSSFNNLTKNDLIIATSFGDSIGRGEFSGKNLSEVNFSSFSNVQGLLYQDVYQSCLSNLKSDRSRAFENSDDNEHWALCELDLQENYMRRMIVCAMGYISQYANLKQLFTSEEVINFIWSLDPSCRNDLIYKELYKLIDMELYSIPWARTGIAFDGTIESNSNLTKEFHDYNKWLRYDVSSILDNLINKGRIDTLNIFDRDHLDQLWLSWNDDGQMDSELILKIAQIELLREKYFIKGINRNLIDRVCIISYQLIKSHLRRIKYAFMCKNFLKEPFK